MAGFGAAATYGASLETYPVLTESLLLPAVVGLAFALGTAALFAPRLGAGTVGLLLASWVAVLGSVAWIPFRGPAPVTSVAIVDWLLVHQSWPSVLATLVAFGCVVAARRLAHDDRAALGIIAVWLAAQAAAGAIEHGGAALGWSPRAGAATTLLIQTVAALTASRLALGAVPIRMRAAWIPSALVLLLGQPGIIRGAVDRGLSTADGLVERIEAGELDPWVRDHTDPGELPPDHALVVLGNGELLSIHRGDVHRLGPRETWAPGATERVAQIIPDRRVTPAQLLAALRRVGTERVGLAAIDYVPTPTPLSAISVRASTQRLVVIPFGFVPYPAPRSMQVRCLDLTALPPDEPLAPLMREEPCLANAAIVARGLAPPEPPPRPWIPARPAWPPLALLAIPLGIALARQRPGNRILAAVALTLIAILTGACLLRAATGA